MRSRAALVAGVVLGVLIVGSATVPLLGGADDKKPAAPPAGLDAKVEAAGAKLISYDWNYGIGVHSEGRVKYPTNPPTNGPHHPAAPPDGSYVGKKQPTTEQVVHSLEHGRVVLQYKRGIAPAALKQLVALYEESPGHLLLVENQTGMPCEVAATAWGHGILCPKVTTAGLNALRAFRDRYRDQGPEAIP
jgi:hypothetical protein